MPLPTRQVDPTFVARSVYEGPNGEVPAAPDLETVTNTTLTNIIRQLSSLSKHSEDLFGELARDAGQLSDRANSLQARIDRLAIKVTQLDSTVEDVSLTDITLKKPFRSALTFDQEIFSRATMPAPMLETYQLCDKPPPLDKLNCYRDDGKDGLKFYTDPNYFFELWRQEMLEDTERMKHDRGKNKMHKPREGGAGQGHGGGGGGGGGGQGQGQGARNKNKKVRQPHNTREKQRQIAIGHGETLMPNNVIYRTPNSVINDPEQHQQQQHYNQIGIYDSRPLANRPNSIELRRSYPAEQIDGGMPQYAPTSPTQQQQAGMMMMNANHYQQAQYQQLQQQQMYDESIYNSAVAHHQSAIYGANNGQGPLSQESLYAPGTPSRKGPRPTQPPPAPPSGGSGGTPNASNANTPTRGRSMSTGRDTLPPPPPVPEGMMGSPPHQQQQIMQQMGMNGVQNVAMMKMMQQQTSVSRSGSPQMMAHHPHAAQDAAMVMHQQQMNQMNAMAAHQMAHHDLPPPPPIPAEQSLSSPPNVAPPPPPPPPPLLDSPPKRMMGNGGGGEMANGGIGGLAAQMSKVTLQKKILPPQQHTDTRSDLMKAIRDGIKLRKVEKIDKLENDKSNPMLHDVASILARRVAIELSESESSGSEDDSEEWVEPNETSA